MKPTTPLLRSQSDNRIKRTARRRKPSNLLKFISRKGIQRPADPVDDRSLGQETTSTLSTVTHLSPLRDGTNIVCVVDDDLGLIKSNSCSDILPQSVNSSIFVSTTSMSTSSRLGRGSMSSLSCTATSASLSYSGSLSAASTARTLRWECPPGRAVHGWIVGIDTNTKHADQSYNHSLHAPDLLVFRDGVQVADDTKSKGDDESEPLLFSMYRNLPLMQNQPTRIEEMKSRRLKTNFSGFFKSKWLEKSDRSPKHSRLLTIETEQAVTGNDGCRDYWKKTQSSREQAFDNSTYDDRRFGLCNDEVESNLWMLQSDDSTEIGVPPPPTSTVVTIESDCEAADQSSTSNLETVHRFDRPLLASNDEAECEATNLDSWIFFPARVESSEDSSDEDDDVPLVSSSSAKKISSPLRSRQRPNRRKKRRSSKQRSRESREDLYKGSAFQCDLSTVVELPSIEEDGFSYSI